MTASRVTRTLLAIGVAVTSGCGGTATTPTPLAGVTQPAPPTTTSAPPVLSTPDTLSLVLAPTAVLGQGLSTATVTLPTTAPAGGAIVTVSTSDASVAHVPSAVTVPAGALSASFSIDTATVASPSTATIVATYNGNRATAVLTVGTPPLSASFIVRSSRAGAGACVLEENEQELDCLLDASASTGLVSTWQWTYTTATGQLSQTSRDPVTRPQIGTKCAFLGTAIGGDGPNGDRYLRMEVSLQVADRSGTRSTVVKQPVRLYPNRLCGFSY